MLKWKCSSLAGKTSRSVPLFGLEVRKMEVSIAEDKCYYNEKQK